MHFADPVGHFTLLEKKPHQIKRLFCQDCEYPDSEETSHLMYDLISTLLRASLCPLFRGEECSWSLSSNEWLAIYTSIYNNRRAGELNGSRKPLPSSRLYTNIPFVNSYFGSVTLSSAVDLCPQWSCATGRLCFQEIVLRGLQFFALGRFLVDL